MDPTTGTRSPYPVPLSKSEWWSTLVDLSAGLIRLLFYRSLAWLFWVISGWPTGALYTDEPNEVPVAGVPRFSNANFDALPPELVEKILAGLDDCHDILTIRRCSRRISTISKTRSVWVNAIQNYLTTHPWLPKPEEPLDAYSSPELERWLVNRTRAQRGWDSANPPQYRRIYQKRLNRISLIPGGRWLLTHPVDGVVTVYDLDTPVMKSKTLISPVDDHDAKCGCVMAISINDKSPVLSFDVSLLSQPFRGYSGRKTEPRLSVWRTTLSGHGQDAELTALRVASFDIPAEKHPHILSLDGEYIARVTGCIIEILRWTKSTSSARMVAVIFCEEQPVSVHFLPGARILSFSNTNMSIYEIPPFEFVPAFSNPTFVAYTLPTWRAPCRGRYLDIGGTRISPIWTDGDITSFTVSTTDGVQAVTVPALGQPSSLRKFKLSLRHGQSRFSLGQNHSLVHDDGHPFILTHRWAGIRDSEPDGVFARRLCPIPSGHETFRNIGSCLDEASARLVLVTLEDYLLDLPHTFLVLDFANIHAPLLDVA